MYFAVDCNCSCYRLQTAGFACTPFILHCHIYVVIVKVKNVKEGGKACITLKENVLIC